MFEQLDVLTMIKQIYFVTVINYSALKVLTLRQRLMRAVVFECCE